MSAFPPRPGTIGWIDLTVPEAERVRDFYRSVVGWEASPVSMGDYDDYNMLAPGAGSPVAGVCHARGANADTPPTWIVYVVVEDLEGSLERCRRLGGEVLGSIRSVGSHGRYCLIRDPAGAALALWEAAGEPPPG